MKEKYLENALKYATAFKAIFEDKVEGEDYKRFSRMEKVGLQKCQEIFESLHKSNRLSEIEEHMFNENPYVRYLASAHGLFSNTRLAEETLENLIESNSHKIRMQALTTLKAWRNIPWTEDRYK